jgi:hypothetical protein
MASLYRSRDISCQPALTIIAAACARCSDTPSHVCNMAAEDLKHCNASSDFDSADKQQPTCAPRAATSPCRTSCFSARRAQDKARECFAFK